MTDPETPPTEPDAPAAAKKSTLSTQVDQETYDWFVAHAEANWRNISGQLGYVIQRYRAEVEGRADPAAFGKALLDGLDRDQPRVPRPGRPYVGDPWPRPTVVWDEAVQPASSSLRGSLRLTPDAQPGQASHPEGFEPPPGRADFPIDDDPEEGVK